MFTDKLVAKIPSTATGKITEIRFGDDDIIPVGHVILKIEEEGDESAAAPTPANQVAPAEPAKASSSGNQVPVQDQVRDKVSTAPPGN